jgi:hypothetical protein
MTTSKLPDIERIYHPYDTWECFHAGFFDPAHCTKIDFEVFQREYATFLKNSAQFTFAIERVFNEWPISCENFLTNNQINRVAWLGQASACIEVGLSSAFKGGFWRLTATEQDIANGIAFENITWWINEQKKRKQIGSTVRGLLDTQLLFEWNT